MPFAPIIEKTKGKTQPHVNAEEEAIELANDTIYGLTAVVYSQDIKRARRVASQIDAGCVDIILAAIGCLATPWWL